MLGLKRKTDPAPEVAEEPPELPEGARLMLELHPRCYELSGLHSAVLRERDALAAEGQALTAAILKGPDRTVITDPGTRARRKELTPPEPTDHPGPVRAILGALAPDFVPRVVLEDPANVQRLDEIKARLAAINASLPIISTELAKAHKEASRLVCDHVRDEYRAKIGGRVLAALKELGDAMHEHAKFRQEFRNVSLIDLRPIPVHDYFGDIAERGSAVRQLLLFACECGHHDVQNIPQHWGRK